MKTMAKRKKVFKLTIQDEKEFNKARSMLFDVCDVDQLYDDEVIQELLFFESSYDTADLRDTKVEKIMTKKEYDALELIYNIAYGARGSRVSKEEEKKFKTCRRVLTRIFKEIQ